jgi:hypothetical protein
MHARMVGGEQKDVPDSAESCPEYIKDVIASSIVIYGSCHRPSSAIRSVFLLRCNVADRKVQLSWFPVVFYQDFCHCRSD